MTQASNLARLLNSSGKLSANSFGQGQVVSSRSYCSGYGSGASTNTSSQSWVTLNINGTGRDDYRPSDNLNVFTFDKARSDTHIRIHAAIPVYSDPAASGCGVRIQCLNPAQTDYNAAGNYITLDVSGDGMAHGWGASGYGGGGNGSNNGAAGIINVVVDSKYNPSFASAIKAKTGTVYLYFQVFGWSSADSHQFITYITGGTPYYKVANWVVEEYVA